MYFHFLVSYECAGSKEVCDAIKGALGTRVAECFDASHVDGRQVVACAIQARKKNTEQAISDKIQAAVWSVNRGLYADVRTLTDEQFDEYC